MTRESLFAYGTLQFPAIIEAVTGRPRVGTPAVLDGYARCGIRDQPFPGIVPRANHAVEGVLYADITPSERRRIDTFEGEPYRRETVRVRLPEEGTSIEAVTYVIRPRWRTIISAAGWDPDEFARHWHDTYVERVANARRAGKLG
ncbi:MAG: gamma-glutamylcyclotransferase family protein [Halofilum sp. (in: g-proteobacteria)]